MYPREDGAEPGSTTESESEDHVVTAFLRNQGEILLARRSDAVGTYSGRWGAISGDAEGDPDQQVRVEITEETGLEKSEVSLVRTGRPVRVVDADRGHEWIVHPYLFDADTRALERSEEHDAFEWTAPTAVQDRPTVPKLWTTYERVAPTVRTIVADDDHGAAYLSVRALEVLRDRAGVLRREREENSTDTEAEWDELAELARRLLESRPSMAVLRNRVNRVLTSALEAAGDGDAELADGQEPPSPETGADAAAVLEAALAGIERAVTSDREAAETAGARLENDDAVMTISRSETILTALRNEGQPPSRVYVAESRPAREGRDVATELAGECSVTLHTDAAVASVLATESIDRVLVGADTIRPDGSVVNKTGTRMLAVAASREEVPVSVVAATDKVSVRSGVNIESGSKDAVYEGDAPIDVLNPIFDIAPADCIDEFLTERGVLSEANIASVATELRELEQWRPKQSETERSSVPENTERSTDRNPSGTNEEWRQ